MSNLLKCFLIIVIVLFANCKINKQQSFVGIDYSTNKYDKKICCCKYITSENSVFWRRDSLGLNGYRRTIAPLLQRECILSESSWDSLKVFFGEPKTIINNLRVNNKEAAIFVYVIFQLTTNPEDKYRSMFFDVAVDKERNIIIKTNIRYTDG